VAFQDNHDLAHTALYGPRSPCRPSAPRSRGVRPN